MTGPSTVLSRAPPPLLRGGVSTEERSKTQNGTGSNTRRENKPRWVLGSSLRPTDVLHGRGSGINCQKGNIHFRQLVKQRKHRYQASKRRAEKHQIAMEILNSIQTRGGRFLQDATYTDRKHFGIPESIQDVWVLVRDKSSLDKIKQALRQKVGYKESSEEGSDPMDAHIEHDPLHWPEVNQGHSEEAWTLVDQSNLLPSVQDRLTSEDAHEEQLEPLDWREQNNQGLSDMAWTLFESNSTETMPSLLSSSFSSEADHEDEEPFDRLVEEVVGNGNELIPASGLEFDQDVFEE
jgi:hypothetical protein